MLKIVKAVEILQDFIVELNTFEVKANGVNLIITTVYVAPHTPAWSQGNYQKLFHETLKSPGEITNVAETDGRKIIFAFYQTVTEHTKERERAE